MYQKNSKKLAGHACCLAFFRTKNRVEKNSEFSFFIPKSGPTVFVPKKNVPENSSKKKNGEKKK
jgi:hypothetical protein